MSARPRKGLTAIRSTMFCYFCGGRVIATKLHTYRCEAEGVSWDTMDNLVLYDHGDGRSYPRLRQRDPRTGKFVSSEASR